MAFMDFQWTNRKINSVACFLYFVTLIVAAIAISCSSVIICYILCIRSISVYFNVNKIAIKIKMFCSIYLA